MNVVLGLDTSCYTTSAAAVDQRGEAVAFSRMLLPVEAGQRGLRQSEAVFAHVRQMPLVMAGLKLPRDAAIVAVCASAAPRDEKDSYMPVFTVGAGHGRVLAEALHVPYYETSHQQGHIAAGQIGLPPFDKRFAALHLSGGTTELLLWDNGALKRIGGSLDLHAGQLVDRVGVKLGLPFPAGPELEKLALRCPQPTEAVLPVSMARGDLECHLSGAEAQAMRLIDGAVYSRERIAAEVFDLLARTVTRLICGGCRAEGLDQALVVGGVASSALLRGMIEKRLRKLASPIDLRFGESRFSADNAAGVAAIGMACYLKEYQA